MQARSSKSQRRSRGAAGVTVTLLLALALLKIDAAAGRPDVRQTPFSLELQPPLLEAAADDAFNAGGQRAIDSYGNPIDALRPIDTPDGRKVVSTQGVQFEIPNYASGITEIRQPADDLLPPHIGELKTTTTTTRTRTTTTAKSTAADGNTGGARTTAAATTPSQSRNSTNQTQNTPATLASVSLAPPPRSTISTTSISFTATLTPTPTAIRTPLVEPLTLSNLESVSNHVKRESAAQQFEIAPASSKHAPPTFTLLTLNPQLSPASPPIKINPQATYKQAGPKQNNSERIDSIAATYSTSTSTPTPSQLDAIAVAEPTSDIASTDSTSLAPATSLTPPKHESSTSTAEVSVEVEKAQLIPLPQQQQQEEGAQEPHLTSGTLPDYILELQKLDKNIGGPVPWTPTPNGAPLSVIAWDLLPPFESAPEAQTDPPIITEQQPTRHVLGMEQPGSHNIRVSLSSGQGLSPVAPVPLTQGHVAVVPLDQDGREAHGTNAHVGSTTPRNGGRFSNRNRGTVHYSTTSAPRAVTEPRSSTTAAFTTTAIPSTTRQVIATTTRRTTTAATTTTTTTTPRPRTTPRVSTSTTPLDPSTFYKLDNEEAYAYTLPPWLQEVTDPDLDVAVTFIVPTDNDQYNHSLTDDLEPPFEPFVDLHHIQLTPPPVAKPTSTKPTAPAIRSSTTPSTTSTTSTTTTTTTTTTTRRPLTIAPPPATRTTKAPIFRAHTTQQQLEQPQLIKTTTHTAPPKNFEVTTTTAASPVDSNPFDSATLPPWLQDFDYPDVGPGVPFNPDNFKESPVESGQKTGARFDTPASGQETQNSVQPPHAGPEEQFPPFNGNAADNQKVEYTKSDEGKVISTPVTGQRKDAQDNSVLQGSSSVSPPVSNTGKYTGGFGAPAGLLRPQSADKPDIYVAGNEHEFSNNVKLNRARPAAAVNVNGGRYTGGFGAPSGVLSPQNAPRPFQATQQPQQSLQPQQPQLPQQPQQPQQQQASSSQPQQVGAASSHQQSRFGGPPGVLVPFDNVGRTGGQ